MFTRLDAIDGALFAAHLVLSSQGIGKGGRERNKRTTAFQNPASTLIIDYNTDLPTWEIILLTVHPKV
jgi:hypothetical protein